MELSNIRRVGGCAQRLNVLGLLFDENESEDILPVRLRASCKHQLSDCCSIEKCKRYRIGTAGSHRISWQKDKRM